MVLLPVPAALAITTAALLAPHKLVADVVFVVIVYAAVYARRFGARGRALGMVAFMAYFFTLYLRATSARLPWLIGAVLVGTVCSFVMTAFVLPDKPEGGARLIGTVLGVPAGMLVATLVAGNSTASLLLIFVCVFCSLYFFKVAYSLMTFWITTMLALLYGLLGEFSLAILHAMRQIDRAVVSAAIDLGADDVVAAAVRTARVG
jgi:Fusaric acid resistance protein-like